MAQTLTMERTVTDRQEGVGEVVRLQSPEALRAAMPCTDGVAAHVARSRAAVRAILAGEDSRLLVVVGPCSVHDAAASREYAAWLLEQRTRHADTLFVVMRVYCDKPRTRTGWTGFIHDPHLDGSDRIDLGLAASRRLLLDINAMGMPVATEFVDVIASPYLADLTTWVAVGARTTESPIHRQMASGLASPVGFKNGTSGDVQVALNALIAAREPHRFLSVASDGRAAMVSTPGNPDVHLILRGGTSGPNGDPASISAASARLHEAGLQPRLMVDCGHGNCGGDYRRQAVVARELTPLIAGGDENLIGVMMESALVEGRQALLSPGHLTYGQSITDGCLGLADTASVLDALATAVAARQALVRKS